ncbi:MAG TPA: serine/threonine-protein kinase, partial [Bacteroidota bacterium]|nr:serine/threonine-protein kinase [Bacteroidota bacterium]
MIGKNISHYHILEKLGEGGMGVVYKAEDLKLKRMVAIKFLPKTLSVHGEERERFTLEAQAASALNHPNVATIYEIDEAGGETFIVMEYVEGKTLRESMQGLTIRQVTDIGIQIAEGLAAAHEKGIVHRDIKAENIMLRKDGRVQVMDFGLAKLRGVSKLTKTGSTIGTIGYMSPEQVQGIETDSRTDIFSLGVVLYELLTRQLPFKGGHEAAVMYEIVNVEPPPVSSIRQDVEPELERIVMKCLEKDREERYHSVKDVSVDLKHFKRDSEGKRIERRTPRPGVAAQPTPAFAGSEVKPARRVPGWLKIAGIALVAVIGVVIWQLLKPPAAVSENLIFKPLQVPFTTI